MRCGGKQQPTGVGLVTVSNPKGPILITGCLIVCDRLLPIAAFLVCIAFNDTLFQTQHYKSRHLPSTPTLSLNPTLSFSFSFFNHFTVTMENGGFHGYRKLPNTTNSAGKPFKYLCGITLPIFLFSLSLLQSFSSFFSFLINFLTSYMYM